MDKLVTEKAMAAMLDVSVSTLQKDRFQYTLDAGKNRLPFVKDGFSVLYRPSLVFAAVAAGKASRPAKNGMRICAQISTGKQYQDRPGRAALFL